MDPYSFTHVLHGLLFYAVLHLLLEGVLGQGTRFLLTVVLECAWEILENTDRVIDAYRESTISLHYYGDTVANSISDVAMCALGYAAARWLPVRASAAAYVTTELVLLLWIRDNLLLSALMLVYPIEAIKTWQVG